jgi:hypothetical protein
MSMASAISWADGQFATERLQQGMPDRIKNAIPAALWMATPSCHHGGDVDGVEGRDLVHLSSAIVRAAVTADDNDGHYLEADAAGGRGR